MLFVIDFDGTVAPTDCVDALLERFADPEWQRIEEQWTSGAISSRECMAAQIALVEGDEEVLRAFLRDVVIDPTFAAFVRYLRPRAAIAVISDGLDYPIACALQRAGLSLPICANRLTFRPGGLGITFPYADPACSVGSGVCKCAAARVLRSDRDMATILVGDGRSDLCIARSADFIFAKGTLRTLCEAEGLPYVSFDTFADVLAVVRTWNSSSFYLAAEENKCQLSPAWTERLL